MTSQTLRMLCLQSSEDLTAANILTVYVLDAKIVLGCAVMPCERGHAQLMFSSSANSC